MKKVLILLLSGFTFVMANSLEGQTVKVIRSLLDFEHDGKELSGAKLIEDKLVNIEDITICVRFNFKLLGEYHGRSQLVHIADWKDEPKVKLFVGNILILQ